MADKVVAEDMKRFEEEVSKGEEIEDRLATVEELQSHEVAEKLAAIGYTGDLTWGAIMHNLMKEGGFPDVPNPHQAAVQETLMKVCLPMC